MLVTAESCTGGWVAKRVTDVSGSSGWFDRGFVVYSNEAKQDLLGVREQTLERYGAVSEQTVREMAEGALSHSRAQISVAVSGIAGPEGGTADKPVGTVWFAWGRTGRPTRTQKRYFAGEREQVRRLAMVFALEGVIEIAQHSA